MNTIYAEPTLEGRLNDAIASCTEALKLNPDLRMAKRNLAVLLVKAGRANESVQLFYEELRDDAESVKWLTGLTTEAMMARDLTLAGEYARILSSLRLASAIHPQRSNGELPPDPVRPPEVFLTISKLQHDIEQFQYLQQKGIPGNDLTPVINAYKETIERLKDRRGSEKVPLDDEAKQAIGHVYNRIIHTHHSPRLKKALSDTWNGPAVERQYLQPPGVVIIDNFLSAEALQSIRNFCLESTVWSGNRYTHGRLGAFFHDGFNCPLLLQVAEELRNTLPSVIGNRYPLRQLWGFKNGQHVPPNSSLHADFAAVNVNFWITPDEANLDPTSGGLIVYGVDAPLDWDFETYNGRPEIIRSFLQQQNAKAVNIPYRQNRAIIFNSDLFHETAEVKFKEGYENRRINITMLYGDREYDAHHSNNHHVNQPSTAMRSGAFGRTRRAGI